MFQGVPPWFQHCSSAEKYRRWVWPRRSPWWAEASAFWLCHKTQSHQIGRTSPRFNCEYAAGGIISFIQPPWLGLSFTPSFVCSTYSTYTTSLCCGRLQSSCALSVRGCTVEVQSAFPRNTICQWYLGARHWQYDLDRQNCMLEMVWSILSQHCTEGMAVALSQLASHIVLHQIWIFWEGKVLYSDSGVLEMVGIML